MKKQELKKKLDKLVKEKQATEKSKYPELCYDGLGNPYLFDPYNVEVDVDESTSLYEN